MGGAELSNRLRTKNLTQHPALRKVDQILNFEITIIRIEGTFQNKIEN